MNTFNPILNTDSYKHSMFLQYPPNTTNIFSYIESRGGRFDNVLFFGLQYFLKTFMSTRVTETMVHQAEHIITLHGEPFNKEGWMYIVKQHNGFLPLKIKAVKEGTVVPVKNVLVTVEVTDPKCFWLTTFIETAMLRAVWYPTTVATNSFNCKKIILKGLEQSGTPELIDFKLHDFGARGVSSYESAGLGGLAHLINFKGTDTITALTFAIDFYGAREVVGYSIPAAEHSTITSWGKDNEIKAYENMLKQFGIKNCIFAVVSDSYDIFNAVDNIWGKTLKQQVIDSGATLVIRPDSGDPLDVLPKILRLAADNFGYTINDKGFMVINNVRFIQGDGITVDSLQNIVDCIICNNFSLDNIAFGMGGGLLQHVNRDDQRFAMKCSAALIDDKWVDVCKDPITDSGKKSKTGRLLLLKEQCSGKIFTLRDDVFVKTPCDDLLDVVYEWNGNDKLLSQTPYIKEQTIDEIRQRVII